MTPEEALRDLDRRVKTFARRVGAVFWTIVAAAWGYYLFG